MVPAEIGNRSGDAIFSRTQPHTSQQDQTAATLNGFLIEDPGKVFFGKGTGAPTGDEARAVWLADDMYFED